MRPDLTEMPQLSFRHNSMMTHQLSHELKNRNNVINLTNFISNNHLSIGKIQLTSILMKLVYVCVDVGSANYSHNHSSQHVYALHTSPA